MPTPRRRPPFAAPDQDRAAPRVEIGFGECQRLADAQPGSRKDDD
jgi:hypothetical protein